MAQLFAKSANAHARIVVVGIVVLACGAGWATSTIYWSPYTTEVDVPIDQSVSKTLTHFGAQSGCVP
jgi:hypothetical protein